MRVSHLLVALSLLFGSLAVALPWEARATGALVAEAGASQIATNGAPLQLSGKAFFGTPPYTFAWSFGGSTARFSDPTSATPTFDTSGLPAGDIVLSLTVTDAIAETATDTVREHVNVVTTLVDVRAAVLVGVPNEILVTGIDSRTHAFTVPAGTTRLTGVLDWGDEMNDFDLELFAGATSATGTTGQTFAKPERVTVNNPSAGSWQARVYPFLSGPDTYHLLVQAAPANPLPAAHANGPYAFGQQDPQALAGSGTGTGLAFAWDLDADGHFETAGATPATAFGVGTHEVVLRVTDAAGFEVDARTTVTVRNEGTILRLNCGGDPTTPYWAMEFTATKNTCWIHGGHHTYFMRDTVYRFQGAKGWAFSVEQLFSPPTETQSALNPFESAVWVETSLDGQAWTIAGYGTYQLLTDRQYVTFDLPASDAEFRFVRIREPLSAAQGLSGYIDASRLDVFADAVGPAPAPALAQGTRALSCLNGDVMEDFFVTHPCWFGGIDRYDAPSFYHTYIAGDGARLDRVTGAFQLLMWRTDDWYQGAPLTTATDVKAFLQTSVNGVAWDTVATIDAKFGVPQAFDVSLGGKDARFVRLFPDYHARYDQTSQFAPNHHPKGYFTHSEMVLEGILPAA